MATFYVTVAGYEESTGRAIAVQTFEVTATDPPGAKTAALAAAGTTGIWTGLTKQIIGILDDNIVKGTGAARESTLADIAANIAELVDSLDDETNSRAASVGTLGSNAPWNGDWQAMAGDECICVSVRSNQNSAANGLVVSWSDDGTNVLFTQSFSVTSADKFLETFQRRAEYYKVNYTNGGTSATLFELITRKIPRFPGLGTPNLPQIVSLSTALPAGTNNIGKVNVQTAKTLLRASINVSSSGDNTETIAAPGGGLKIKIVSLFLHNTTSSDTTVVLKSGSTLINGSGVVLKDTEKLLYFNGLPGLNTWDLNTNEALIINLDGANNISGYITYYVE